MHGQDVVVYFVQNMKRDISRMHQRMFRVRCASVLLALKSLTTRLQFDHDTQQICKKLGISVTPDIDSLDFSSAAEASSS